MLMWWCIGCRDEEDERDGWEGREEGEEAGGLG